MLQLVFAHNGLNFGSNDGMPWPHISQDFKNFKLRTTDTILVMGAKTFASLPGMLPNRKHIVVCDLDRMLPVCKNGAQADNYLPIEEFENYLLKWRKSDSTYSIIGGAGILEVASQYADIIWKTEVTMHPLDRKDVTQWLSNEFLNNISRFGVALERHYYKIDLTTSIEEVKYCMA